MKTIISELGLVLIVVISVGYCGVTLITMGKVNDHVIYGIYFIIVAFIALLGGIVMMIEDYKELSK